VNSSERNQVAIAKGKSVATAPATTPPHGLSHPSARALADQKTPAVIGVPSSAATEICSHENKAASSSTARSGPAGSCSGWMGSTGMT
jgi:hypothetical protein